MEELPKPGQNWQCPYCGFHQAVVKERRDSPQAMVHAAGSVHGKVVLEGEAVVCSNAKCRQLTFRASLYKATNRISDGRHIVGDLIEEWALLPASSARPQPEYILAAIRKDYEEACRIRDLSPKASATMARRCLQGMIRDFCGITRKRLIEEINALRTGVEQGKAPAGVQPDTIDAIDHVRSIGNIGAHMEADINVIVDVDPDEAQHLIRLLELLFDEWYVARHVRGERLKAIGLVAAEKKAAKDAKPA